MCVHVVIKLFHFSKHKSVPFPCDECGKVFTNLNAMNGHKKRKHSVIKNIYICVV